MIAFLGSIHMNRTELKTFINCFSFQKAIKTFCFSLTIIGSSFVFLSCTNTNVSPKEEISTQIKLADSQPQDLYENDTTNSAFKTINFKKMKSLSYDELIETTKLNKQTFTYAIPSGSDAEWVAFDKTLSPALTLDDISKQYINEYEKGCREVDTAIGRVQLAKDPNAYGNGFMFCLNPMNLETTIRKSPHIPKDLKTEENKFCQLWGTTHEDGNRELICRANGVSRGLLLASPRALHPEYFTDKPHNITCKTKHKILIQSINCNQETN